VYGLLPPRSEAAPYHRHVDETNLIKDEYVVVLHKNYTLQDHFDFIGTNLETSRYVFHKISSINGYRARLEETTLHDIIRHDPGVLFVEHDTKLEPIQEVSSGKEFLPPPNTTASEASRLSRRWDKVHGLCSDWWAEMMQISRKIPLSRDHGCVSNCSMQLEFLLHLKFSGG